MHGGARWLKILVVLIKMTKSELEEYGRSLGIELDKRLKKADLIKQIQEFLEAPQTIDSIENKTRSSTCRPKTNVASDSDINALISGQHQSTTGE